MLALTFLLVMYLCYSKLHGEHIFLNEHTARIEKNRCWCKIARCKIVG